MRGVRPDARAAEHPGAVMCRVPARADPDQQDPATREPLGSRLSRLGIGEQPAELRGLRTPWHDASLTWGDRRAWGGDGQSPLPAHRHSAAASLIRRVSGPVPPVGGGRSTLVPRVALLGTRRRDSAHPSALHVMADHDTTATDGREARIGQRGARVVLDSVG